MERPRPRPTPPKQPLLRTNKYGSRRLFSLKIGTKTKFGMGIPKIIVLMSNDKGVGNLEGSDYDVINILLNVLISIQIGMVTIFWGGDFKYRCFEDSQQRGGHIWMVLTMIENFNMLQSLVPWPNSVCRINFNNWDRALPTRRDYYAFFSFILSI